VQRASSSIPIVFVGVSDPIGAGFIRSLARPGGNLTGVLNFETAIAGKWLAMLKEVAPRVTRAAFVANPKTSPYDYLLQGARAGASLLEIELVSSPIGSAADIERVIEAFSRLPTGALVLPPCSTINTNRDLVIMLAARHRLPATYAYRYLVSAGGLMSYGPDQIDQFRLAASYVDRILRGEKPADLPVQVPIKYETVVNLKTAKALGLEMPSALLARADEVFE
jgi:putative ABC transport system substrate-binding protein